MSDSTPVQPQHKTCKTCGGVFPATDEFFYKAPTCKDGLRGSCKKCRDTYVGQWCNDHRTRRREIVNKSDAEHRDRSKAWREAHRDELLVKSRERYRKNRLRYAQAFRDYYERNKESIKAYKRRWHVANRDKIVARNNRRRAVVANAEGSYTAAEVRTQLKSQKGRCWWCGKRIIGVYHIDHRIPLTKGGKNDAGNICISCPVCNLRKHDKMPWEWNGRLL